MAILQVNLGWLFLPEFFPLVLLSMISLRLNVHPKQSVRVVG